MATPYGAKYLEIAVSNFGPIAEASIELRPMSVFVGPSNTGKSYLAALIYALHRFFGAYAGGSSYVGWHSVINSIYSTMEDEPTLSEDEIRGLLKWARETNPYLETRRHVSIKLPECDLTGAVAESVRRVLGGVSSFEGEVAEELLRCFGVPQIASLRRHSAQGGSRFALSRAPHPSTVGDGSLGYYGNLTENGVVFSADATPTIPLRTYGDGAPHTPLRHFSWPDIFAESGPEQVRAATGLLEVLSRSVVAGIVSPLTRPTHYLPANRSGIMQSHQMAVQGLIAQASRRVLSSGAPAPGLPGVLADFLSTIVALGEFMPHSHVGSPPVEVGDHTDLALTLEQNVLGGAIKVFRGEIAYPAFAYRPKGWQHDLPLMNTSSMVSELAPVALYLRYVVQPGDTLIIEEPESHLHPAMQVEFTRLLAQAVKSGIRIIVTTHSEWVLEELANLVLMSELPAKHRDEIPGARSALSSDEVGAWLFEPDTDSGGSVVKEIPLDKELGNFPSGFGLITTELYNRFSLISNRIERFRED